MQALRAFFRRGKSPDCRPDTASALADIVPEVVSSSESTMTPKSAVIVPLYIYPESGLWEPLHTAIAENPTLKFIIIVNPHNGPGDSVFPDEDYSREIPKLNAAPNVTTVGYVRVGYCKRNLTEVFRDIGRYAGWGGKQAPLPTLGVHGIFVDETPNEHSVAVASYLKSIDQYIKASAGFMGERLTIHNPGTVVDPELAKSGPDITTVVEESYANYQSTSLQDRMKALLRYERPKCAFMVHSVPDANIQTLVRELRHRGEYIFVTDLCEDYYCHFAPGWKTFIEAMALAK